MGGGGGWYGREGIWYGVGYNINMVWVVLGGWGGYMYEEIWRREYMNEDRNEDGDKNKKRIPLKFPRGSIGWLLEEARLKREAFAIKERMDKLMKRADVVLAQVEALMLMGEKGFGKLSWEERESWYKQADGLNEVLRENDEELRRLDGEYNGIRVRVNELYGEEVLKKSDPLPPIDTYDSIDSNREGSDVSGSLDMGNGGIEGGNGMGNNNDGEGEDRDEKEGEGWERGSDWWKCGE